VVNKVYLKAIIPLVAGFVLASQHAPNIDMLNMAWIKSVKKVSAPPVSPFANRQEYKNLLALQDSFIKNAKAVKPLVVSINSVQEQVENSHWTPLEPGAELPWYLAVKEWVVKKLSPKKYSMENLGSGLLMDAEGHILTNYHVVEDSDKMLVKFMDGRSLYGDIVGVDAKSDLAVIKVSSYRDFPVPQFGSTKNLEVGEWVMAIGNPYGLEGTVTVGVVSGKSRYDLGIATYENFIQTDASINPGNSGGPLINLDGQIIGINTAVAELGSGVGFAIPIETALQVGEQLIKYGDVDRGWLGVGIQSMTPELADSFSLSKNVAGVLVNNVQKKTPAERAGLLRGDIIIKFDGDQVPDSKKFQNMVAETKIGKRVKIHIMREGREKHLWVKIGKLYS